MFHSYRPGDALPHRHVAGNHRSHVRISRKWGHAFKILLLIGMIGVYLAIDITDHATRNNTSTTALRELGRSLGCTVHGVLQSRLSVGRRLCEVETKLASESFESAFAEIKTYEDADYETPRPESDIAFVLTIPSCPEDTLVADDDPGLSFYDAAAVLRDSVCNCTNQNPESGSQYGATMYAILHPDAIHCAGPATSNGQQRRSLESTYNYDRVAILEELGFWVILWREPLSLSNIPNSNAYLKSQIETQGAGIRDLMRLYAYNLTRHPVAVLMNFDTVFLNPVDNIVNQFISNNDKKAFYSTKPNGNVNVGSLYIKPQESEFVAILNSFQSTSYDATTGWGGTNVTGVGAEAILTYHYLQNNTVYTENTSIKNDIISFSSNPNCGKPWMCHYDGTWDNETIDECRQYHHAWFEHRQSFEQRWSKTDGFDTTGTNFHNDFFLGYCTSIGEDGYPRASDYGFGSLYLTQNDFMVAGNGVSFTTDTELVMESSTSSASDFGVVISTHAFNADDVDFQVDFVQTSFADVQSGYESQLYLFFIETGTYPEELLQPDNLFHEFEALTAAYTRSKIFTTMNHTWFNSGAGGSTTSRSRSDKLLELSMRIRRLNNSIYAYYQDPGTDEWLQIGTELAISPSLYDVPLQFGLRVKKQWQASHRFEARVQKMSGGPPIPIPTRNPTNAPTEVRTPIVRQTSYKEPVCPMTFDRSSWDGYAYEVRGVGGGGAMSGLSISPWNNLWFVGTDMGTLFRSTDAGQLWYPVSHYEAKFYSHLPVSAPVGFSTDPSIVVHASCHQNVAERDCVAQRSIDGGATWNPINVTGGTRVDHLGNPALEYIPKQWTGSLIQNSGIMYVTVFGSGNIYKSIDDGFSWTAIGAAYNISNEAVGLYLDETAAPDRYIYFATTHEILMWKEGEESQARQLWTTDGSILLQSFTGARNVLETTGLSMISLAFVDDDNLACGNDVTTNCGYVHTTSAVVNASSSLSFNFSFVKTAQKGFRVASSPTDAQLLYVTGARSWPSATGTSVWTGLFDDVNNEFVFGLKFRQYPVWDVDKLDYSGVGLDVGYWDGGYYTWGMNPNNSSVAGGSGNFFLHITRDAGGHWESPFTEYADGCNTNGERVKGRRWRSTGLEMTSVRTVQFNPFNSSYAFASVADIRMLRSDDGGNTFEITGGDNTDPLFRLNSVYDYDFAGPHTVFAVGGNFHDWPHGWYKNLLRGAGGVYVSFNSGDNWHRVGSEESINCDNDFKDVDCSLGDDMVRQILSVFWDESVGGGTLYVGTHSAGVARLEGLNQIMNNGTIEEMQDLQWEWINSGLGNETGRIIPEIKKRNGNLYCLLTGNAPHYNNTDHVGIYKFDEVNTNWIHKRYVVNRHSAIAQHYDLWAYATSFDVDQNGTLWLADLETNGNYLASGIWKSSNDGATWDRRQQFTFPYQIIAVGDRIYASGARSISQIGNAGWGDGGAFHSDDGGITWVKNENIPLLSNLNSVTVDPSDHSKVFYTFFGGGMLYGPVP